MNSVQVELALSGLDRHKATIDIPNYLIKIAAICFPLPSQTYLMNQLNQVLLRMSSRSPKFPQSSCKTGVMTDPGNYRPIAVLSPFAKILERDRKSVV